MGTLFDEHEGWTREDLDEMFGSHPDHASAPTRAELEAELEAEEPWPSDEEPDECDSSPHGWTDLSDDEIKKAMRRICRDAKSDQDVKDRLRDELGYPYGDAAVTSTSHGSMRMTMVMLHGPNGNTLSI